MIAPEGKRLTNLIGDLNSGVFTSRHGAMNELTKFGELAEPALSQALEKAPTLEARRRFEQLLARLQNIGASGAPLRQSRALEVLENIGTPEARHLLSKLSGGAPHANLTREAKSTLDRLARLIGN